MTWPAPDPSIATPVSCIIIAKNEADRIARTIRSVEGIAAEVVVVDSGSTDGTQQVCTDLGARVVTNAWPGYGPQKRFAEDQARHDYILNLDADEWLPDDLRLEIIALLASPAPPKSALIKVRDVYPARDRPAPFANYKPCVRLYDRRVTRFAESLIHDSVPPTADLHTFRASAYHRSFRSLAHMITKEISYFELQKKERKMSPFIAAVRLVIEGPLQFLKFYILRRHVFGGLYGFVYALTLAFLRWVRLPIQIGW